jgi:hypothetical protein
VLVVERVTGKRTVLEEESTGVWKDLERTGELAGEIRSVSGVSKRRRDSGRQIQYVTRGETTMVGGWPYTIE